MGNVAIQGLMYNGKQAFIDDGVVTNPVPPTGTVGSYTTIVSNVKVGSEDNWFLTKMKQPYSVALKTIPGSHQVYFDILTDSRGRTYSDGQPQPVNTVNDAALKQQINVLINDGSYNCPSTFDPAKYTGFLKTIYDNLVKWKLAGN